MTNNGARIRLAQSALCFPKRSVQLFRWHQVLTWSANVPYVDDIIQNRKQHAVMDRRQCDDENLIGARGTWFTKTLQPANSFIPFVRFQWVNRLTLSGMSVGPLFPVDRTGHLVLQVRQLGSNDLSAENLEGAVKRQSQKKPRKTESRSIASSQSSWAAKCDGR